MMRAFRGLFLHGVGEQGPDFAEDAHAWLRQACGRLDIGTQLMSAHWAPLADKPEDSFLRRVEARGSAGRPLQRLVIKTLADALMYAKNPELQAGCFALLDRQTRPFSGQPFVLFAHSLGGLIATDWLRARPAVRVRLVTFGCNIGLFTLGQRFQAVPQISARGSWLNLWDKNDMLGYPLAVTSELAHVRDVQVRVGSWLTAWNGLSHTGYWDDRKLWRETIPELLADGP